MVEELGVAEKLPRLEDLLKEEGVIIEKSTYDVRDIDASVLEGKGFTNERNIFELLIIIRQFLNGPLVRDNFINHDDRRDWEKKVVDKFGEEARKIFDRNKLGGNRLNVVNVIDLLNVELKNIFGVVWSKSEEYNLCKREILSLRNKILTPEEKDKRVALVRELSEFVFDFYKVFVAAVKNKQSPV